MDRDRASPERPALAPDEYETVSSTQQEGETMGEQDCRGCALPRRRRAVPVLSALLSLSLAANVALCVYVFWPGLLQGSLISSPAATASCPTADGQTSKPTSAPSSTTAGMATSGTSLTPTSTTAGSLISSPAATASSPTADGQTSKPTSAPSSTTAGMATSGTSLTPTSTTADMLTSQMTPSLLPVIMGRYTPQSNLTAVSSHTGLWVWLGVGLGASLLLPALAVFLLRCHKTRAYHVERSGLWFFPGLCSRSPSLSSLFLPESPWARTVPALEMEGTYSGMEKRLPVTPGHLQPGDSSS
ncbi:mucin-6-like isoform X3 [Lepisosteus oculatus]|uniref:mucin-6-like isoform X3 n=1 Tax=Lepisosteus oculatus TaxID=7918 RepID=UPI003722A1DE